MENSNKPHPKMAFDWLPTILFGFAAMKILLLQRIRKCLCVTQIYGVKFYLKKKIGLDFITFTWKTFFLKKIFFYSILWEIEIWRNKFLEEFCVTTKHRYQFNLGNSSWIINFKAFLFDCFCIIRKRVALVIPRLKTERHVESSLIQKHFKLPKLKFIYAWKLSDILNRNFLRHI